MINSGNGAAVAGDDPGSSANAIVFCASHGAMYQGLVQAIQAHFPDHEVVLLEHLPEPDIFGSKVRLLLLDHKAAGVFASTVASCREHFPHTAIGVVMRDAEQGSAECEGLFDSGEIQGLLPLDLKLEVWLAAMSLLLQGGEYCPPALARRAHPKRPVSHSAFDQMAAFRIPIAEAIHLTRRERQVLELLSEGYQNKLIADRMALSEHTVKVHVHNLITKMRVSNRTQAAAAYRSGRYATPTPLNGQSLLGAYQFRGRH